ncbi:MAG: DUF192 domain-containing protein [Patescibacteria group bacterium]
MKNFFFLLLGLLVIFGSVYLLWNRPVNMDKVGEVVKINDISFQVELADTAETRQQGLSGKPSLGDKEGMFFIFNTSDTHGFWMKDMKFAIDIIWISENGQVVHVERAVEPETYPNVFYPSVPAKYVLELASGSANKYRIDIGAVVQ